MNINYFGDYPVKKRRKHSIMNYDKNIFNNISSSSGIKKQHILPEGKNSVFHTSWKYDNSQTLRLNDYDLSSLANR